MADKDLDELGRSFTKAADAAGKLTAAERKLEAASDDAAVAIGKVAAQALNCIKQIEALEAKLAAATGVATPLKKALSDVNGEMAELIGLSKGGDKATDAFAKGFKDIEKAANGASRQIEGVTKAQKSGNETLKLSSDEVKKLGGSLKSAFTSLASGADPFKVFLEQGPAVAEVLAKASAGGIGLKGVFLGAAEAIAPMLLPLAGVAAAAAALAAPFAFGAAAINKANGDITKGLGLTEEQLSKVTHRTVTMGDVFQATINVVAKHLSEGPIANAMQILGDMFSQLFSNMVRVVIDRLADIVGFWVAAYDTITKNWKNLSLALGAIFVGAVNLAIRSIEGLVNGVLGGINIVIGAANKIPGIKLQPFAPIDIPELQAIGGQAAQAVQQGFEKKGREASANFKAGAWGLLGEISTEGLKVAQEAARKQAGPMPRGRGTQGAARVRQERDYGDVVYKEPVSVQEALRPATVEPVTFIDTGLKEAAESIDAVIKPLDAMVEKLLNINALSLELGKRFEAAFGKTGTALSGLLTSFSAYSLEVAKIDRAAAGARLSPEEQEKRTQAQIKGYAAMAGAAQGFFKENTAGYKALEVAEIAFNTLHTLNTIKAMALETASAGHTAATQAAKQGSYGATAYAHALAEVPFPFNLLAGAAVLAALVQAGAAIKGKPGGGSVPGVDDRKTRQDTQGSGSVLGDSKAKSESLEKALTHAQAYENKDLEYGNAMVRSLRSIDDQIGAVAAALARSFGAGGMLSTEGLNLGKTGTTASLSNFGFSKSTTRTLQDQGVQFDAATLGAIADGGLSGSTYQQVLETTKKKALFVTTSSKSKVITETGALDGDFLDQVTKLIGSLGKGVADAAKALQATGVEEILASFTVDLGKLSFKDMTGTQIEEALNAIFGKLGDDMAKAAVPTLAQFQKVGEGAFETLVRVARQYEVIDATLKSVGMTFKTVGVSSLEARERLVDLVGGLDNLTDQVSFFAEHFLTEEERLAPVKASVAKQLTDLGLSPDLTREGFKTAVIGLDLSKAEDARRFAALMGMASAFDKVAAAAENATKAAEDHAKEVADRKSSIQDQIDELTMTPAQLLAKSRAIEMKSVKELDETLVPFVETLWKLQDAAQAAAEATQLATDRSNMLADLMDAQGRTEEAKQLRRTLALAQIKDPVQQLYQQQIWAAEDAAAKVSAARDVLTQAYQKEHDTLEATRDRFRELATSLRAFSASLTDTMSGADLATRYNRTRQTFLATASLARTGDAEAMQRLQADGEAFTAVSRDYVATSLDYLRDVGLVRSAVDEAAATADAQVSIAEKQLTALEASVEGLIQINTNVISVAQAIANLQAANAQAAAAGVVSVGGQPIPGAANPGAAPSLTQAQKALNSANFDWILVNSMAGKANAGSTDPVIKAVNDNAARYVPGYMDIVNTQGIDAANALVEAGKLSFWQTGSLKLATGGSFEVGGSGPPDSKLFNLALSPGEAVNVRRGDSPADQPLVNELRRLREELADLRATSVRIANSNDKMERTLTNVTEGGRAMITETAA